MRRYIPLRFHFCHTDTNDMLCTTSINIHTIRGKKNARGHVLKFVYSIYSMSHEKHFGLIADRAYLTDFQSLTIL